MAAEQTETRECRSCLATGHVLLDAEYDAATGELVQETTGCPICKGSGAVYVYPTKPRGERRP